MSENTGSSKKRKALSATLAVAMAATMLLSGTLAYFYRSTAKNVLTGESQVKKVVGHDDFDPVSGNKDIYLENLGEAPVYVRIRLTEDFKISEAGSKELPSTYYTSDTLTANNSYEEIVVDETTGETRGSHVHGAVADKEAEIDFAAGDDPAFHETYFKWTMGGTDSQKTYLSGNSTEYVANDATAPKHKDVDAPLEGETEGTLRLVYDTTNTAYQKSESNPDVKETPAQDNMMAMSEWITLSPEKKCSYTGWIFDDTDATTRGNGWYYWSQPVAGGASTGLLLDHVETLTKLKDGDYTYEYHIHVEFEAVNEADRGLWTGRQTLSTSGDEWAARSDQFVSNPAVGFLNFLSGKVRYGEQLETMCTELVETDQTYQTLQDGADEEAKKQICYEAWGLIKQAIAYIEAGDIEEAMTAYQKAMSVKVTYDPDTYVNEILFAETDTTGENPKIDPKLFAHLVAHNDLDRDRKISAAEARAVRDISINTDKSQGATGIKTLNGITDTYFPNLTRIQIRVSEISAVNTAVLPKNIETVGLTDAPLSAFDASELKNLKALSLPSTNVTETTLKFDTNNRITILDLRSTGVARWCMATTPYVTTLMIDGTALKQLDLRGLKKNTLEVCNIGRTVNLKKLDLSVLSNKIFPNVDCAGKKAVIRNEDQTVVKGIPEGADYIRVEPGKVKDKDGTIYTDEELDEKINGAG